MTSLLMSFHAGLMLYVNSSFLGSLFSNFEISLIFGLGSIFYLVLLLFGETITREIRIKHLFLLFSLIEIIAVSIIAGAQSPMIIAVAFIIEQGVIGFLSYILDVVLERYMKKEETTGEVRGMFLSAANVALVVSPLIAGVVVVKYGFNFLYYLSVVVFLPVLFLHFNKWVSEHTLPKTHAQIPKNLRLGIVLNFLLQFFYGWMIVWSPIYLNKNIGLSWETIGLIFSVMLLAFVFFELPLGELGDRMFSEKSIMSAGFFVCAIATALIAAIHTSSFVVWALALFVTRVGACAIEISTESFFFKHVSGKDTGTIGLFRTVKPLSFILAPIMGAFFIKTVGFELSFLALGAIMFLGVFGATRLKEI